MTNENELYDLAELFKVFSDSSRIRILYSIFEKEKSVSEIASEVEMSISAVSHQLKLLKLSNLISSKREGKQIYYSLADDHVKTIIEMGQEHIREI